MLGREPWQPCGLSKLEPSWHCLRFKHEGRGEHKVRPYSLGMERPCGLSKLAPNEHCLHRKHTRCVQKKLAALRPEQAGSRLALD